MALLAGPTERTLMDIIGFVAVVADSRQHDLCDVLGRVTGMALNPAMPTRQRIASLCVVIETPARPAIWVVTLPAIGPEPTFVVPILMTP